MDRAPAAQAAQLTASVTKGGAPGRQPFALFRSRNSSQNAIAMRKPAEALDDIAMLFGMSCSQGEYMGKFGRALGAQAPERAHRFLL